jgi:hypothetical protein
VRESLGVGRPIGAMKVKVASAADMGSVAGLRVGAAHHSPVPTARSGAAAERTS